MSKNNLNNVIKKLAGDMAAGRLDQRGEISGLSPEDSQIVVLVNGMLDALVAPLRLAGGALDQVAHGCLPPFVVDEYQGEFHTIKQNINTLLAILYGMHGETSNLTSAIAAGRLSTRGNDWDYEGIWQELIGGINSTLDAVIAPIHEAGEVLQGLASYNLKARMRGKYHGEHAAIRKAMNATAEALNEAISQVAATVSLVSEVGAKINTISSAVATGAQEQRTQLDETLQSINHLSQSAQESAERSRAAHGSAKHATELIQRAKEAMNDMVVSMDEINAGAGNTVAIAADIDGIAKETGTIATSAVEKAVRMRVSAGGFGVVAQEIRKLSVECSQTAEAMKGFEQRLAAEQRGEFTQLIAKLQNIARFSNLLGVNASIEAAHVEGAGHEFKEMTDEIHLLAERSAESAATTGELTGKAASLAEDGAGMSREIDALLGQAAEGAKAISEFADVSIQTIEQQTAGLEQLGRTTEQVTTVTERNAAGAADALDAARDLQGQVDSLTKLVGRFKF